MKSTFALLFEKVLSTYVQVFVTGLLASATGTVDVSTAQVAAIAAIPAALTALANGLPTIPSGLPFLTDLGLRTIRTYAVSFVGLLVAAPAFGLSVSAATTAALGAIPAALAVIKGGLARRYGVADSAAFLPTKLDPAAVDHPEPVEIWDPISSQGEVGE